MQLQVLTTSITEPVTHDEVKAFMGYPLTDTSQDDLIDSMITTSREFLEQRTSLSFVSKSYKAYYEDTDCEDGWYELPVSPVLALPAISVSMSGVVTTFQQKGLKRISIRPDSVIGTIPVGVSSATYMEVTFQAGETSNTANDIIKRLVSFLFNHREDGLSLSIARLPFDTLSLINSISVNW